MCTAISFVNGDHYFGRTLDHNTSYGEEIFLAPAGYDFKFRKYAQSKSKYAIKGVAHVVGAYPLFYDGINDAGLCIAGLNFPGNAKYGSPESKNGIAVFEFIPWILGRFSSVDEAVSELKKTDILDIPFASEIPSATLHWMLADKEKCVVIERTEGGLRIHDDPVRVMTNNPQFDIQLSALEKYNDLTPNEPADKKPDSLGTGAVGLPGDWSSRSRFARGAFALQNSVSGCGEEESVAQFFSVIGTVSMPRGVCRLTNGEYEHTVYTVCYDADKFRCYFKDGRKLSLEVK